MSRIDMPEIKFTPFEKKVIEEFIPITDKIKNIYRITEEIEIYADRYIGKVVPHICLSFIHPSKTNPLLFVHYQDKNLENLLKKQYDIRKFLEKEDRTPDSSNKMNRSLLVVSENTEPEEFSEFKNFLAGFEETGIKINLIFQQDKKNMGFYAKLIPE